MQGFPALRKTVTTKWKNSIIFQMCFILPITWKFAQNLPSLLFSVYKHYAINIADPNSIQDTCHMNFVIDLAHCHCLWLSGRALECRIRRSEIRFLIGTRNFFFVPHSWHNRKKYFSTCKRVTCFCATISRGWMNGKIFTILSLRSFV